MFTYIIMAGSGAITYLMARKGSAGKDRKWHTALIEYIIYVMLDMLAVYYCMSPLGRITRVDGAAQIQYGNIAVVFSIFIAVIMGFVFMAVKKKIDIGVEIKSR